MTKPTVKKCVLAYSGGLDTSAIVAWLRENYDCEVICMTADLGQAEELSGLEAKALASGASKIYIEDLRDEFLREYVFPTLRAGAVYEREYLLGTSFARPVIAKRMVEIAEAEGADAVSHGCTGKGNDQVRFELTFKALNPRLTVIAPWREWEIRSREDALAYCAARNIPVQQSRRSIYSRDRNIWHISHEGGILEDPWQEPEEEMFTLTTSPLAAPDAPEYLEIGFEQGIPVSLNGVALGPVELVSRLNQIGGRHGVGRVDMVENRLVGIKSRGVYETPGGTLLYKALQGVESLVLDGETMHYKDLLAQKYAELVYYGRWFTPLREALDACMEVIAQPVTGTARLRVYKGSCALVGRKSHHSLYREDYATFGEDNVYDQADAQGFINLYGLSMKVRALLGMASEANGDLPAPDYTAFKRD
jgi:argininosuccinate synthase